MSTEAALERVRALAQSWASLPDELDSRVGTVILGMLDSATAADIALSRVGAVAESWLTPGGPGLFYPAAGQAVFDAIRGGSTETEAGWRSRAEAAEARLAEVDQTIRTFLAVRGLATAFEDLAEALRQVTDRKGPGDG